MSDNIMKQIKIGKVVVNISVGQSGQPLANAMQILADITGQAPSQRSAKMTIRQWGIRKGEPMACAVTLRGEKADAFLSEKESVLLRFLESRRGAVVSREDIARYVWPELPGGSQGNQAIDESVERLRASIEDDPLKPARLITVGQFGYLLL